MAEYIDREALDKALTVAAANDKGKNRRTWAKAICVLHDLPADDVVPVVHGRWDDSGRYTFPSGNTAVRCTNCGCALAESEYHLYDWIYCPICGARMDGGDDGETD